MDALLKPLVRWFLALMLLSSFGCPLQEPQAATPDGNVGVDPNTTPNQRISGEPNDNFDQAVDVVWTGADSARLSGSISNSNDVDVYSLGPLNAGDRLVVEVGTPGSLDAAIALFDEAGLLAFENDDRDLSLGQLDPFLNAALRRTSSRYFLAISAAPLADNGNLVGEYSITIQLARGGMVPATAGQLILLDFDGGTISIPYDEVYRVGPFNAADIDPAYAGLTPLVRQQILSTVLENFRGLQLDVRVVPGDILPPAGTYSRVLFGGNNPGAFGISQDVDSYNQNHADESIIFTNEFIPARFRRVLRAEELGIAIGNVATHEVGHLLGLNHVANDFDLMDTVGGADTLLLDQDFISSPLHDSIFPIGWQDSYLLLSETLGPAR